jgi:hypothetical protein
VSRVTAAALVAASVLAVAALATTAIPSASAGSTAATVCDRFAAADQTATLGDPVLDEVSGIAASRVHRPLLWVHDDSGGAPDVYAIRPDGSLVGTYTIAGATNFDWEDIAIGPGPKRDTSYLFVGDIGGNLPRDHLTVYRVAEPKGPITPTGTLTGAAVIALHFPDQPVDAESMFVDPRRGDLYLVDKEYTSGIGRVFQAPQRVLTDGADVTLREVASFTLATDDPSVASPVARFPGSIITSADISPDGSTILVRTYRRVLAFSRPAHATVAAAFRRPPCAAPQIDEPQGEAVGFAANGASYFTTSEGEGAAVHRFTIHPSLHARPRG